MTGSIDLKNTYYAMKKKSKLDLDFGLMAILSVLIAVVGLSIDSPAVVIGAMLVSPLLFTILVIASALVFMEYKTALKSFMSLIVELIVLIVLSGLMAELIHVDLQSSEIVERLNTNLIFYFLIALFSGIAGTFAYYWPNILEAITGVAISVALIPPIAMVGITLTNISDNIFQTSLEILIVNLWGIFVGAVITLLFLRLREGYIRSRETIEK